MGPALLKCPHHRLLGAKESSVEFDIRDITSVVAITFSFFSLVITYFNFRTTHRSKKIEQRNEIFSLLIEANLICQRTKSELKNLEDSLKNQLPNEGVCFEEENRLADRIGFDIDSVISQLQNKKESHDDLYVVSKQLVSAITFSHQTVRNKIEKYKVA